MSSTHNHCLFHHHYQAWCHQIFFVNNTKIFVTPSVFKLQKWFLHQNGIELNQKSKSDDYGPLYKVTWRCLAVPQLPKDVLKMASDLISVIQPFGHCSQLCTVLQITCRLYYIVHDLQHEEVELRTQQIIAILSYCNCQEINCNHYAAMSYR